ncbi:hypothetical protein IW140_002730 [Coemansia sp. RSA 1813]|nr:hypothetical protein EV179_003542 [Coemansia sp. RSA 487]KAJ2569842.1 hypothetical protein IW140_002730 [Coemansia sp. RSA 1813]
MRLDSFWLGQSIGSGRLVEHKETQDIYVLSTISKKADTSAFIAKRNLLEQLDHPFIASLRYSFQDAHHLYILTDMVSGGTLRSHMDQLFSESAVKLWAAELASALHYMHAAHGVAHGNLCANTVLLDRRGHAVIGGLDSSMHVSDGQLLFAEDWRALGVLMYECLYGRNPFENGATDAVAYFPVVAGQRTTHDCMSAIRGLLNRDPASGLGNGENGMLRLRMHPFFATLDWDLLEQRQHCSLYIPPHHDVSCAGSDCYHPPAIETSHSCVAEFLNYDHSEYSGFKQCYFDRDSMPEEVVLGGRALLRSRGGYATPPQDVPIDPYTWGSMHRRQQELAIRYSAKLDKTYELYSALDEYNQDSDDLDSMFQSAYSLTSASLLTATRGDAAALNKRSTIVSTAPSRNTSSASLLAAAAVVANKRPTAVSVAPSRNTSNESYQSADKENQDGSWHSLQHRSGQKPRYILTAAGPRPLLTSSMPRLKPIASAEWNRPQLSKEPLPAKGSPLQLTRPMQDPSPLYLSQNRLHGKDDSDDLDLSDWEIINT